jgi:hypothetical protein
LLLRVKTALQGCFAAPTRYCDMLRQDMGRQLRRQDMGCNSMGLWRKLGSPARGTLVTAGLREAFRVTGTQALGRCVLSTGGLSSGAQSSSGLCTSGPSTESFGHS